MNNSQFLQIVSLFKGDTSVFKLVYVKPLKMQVVLFAALFLIADARPQSQRTILDDFKWIDGDFPESSKVVQKGPSFFHLDDLNGGLSETLEIELDNAKTRRLGQMSERGKAKRETPFPAIASPVKQQSCKDDSDDFAPIPMKVVSQKKTSFIPKKTVRT